MELNGRLRQKRWAPRRAAAPGGEAGAGAAAAAPRTKEPARRSPAPLPPRRQSRSDTTLIYLLSSLRDELSVPSKDDKNEIEKCLS